MNELAGFSLMGENIDLGALQKWTTQIVLALCFLHSKGVIHHALSLSNVALTEKFDVKLAGWGMFHITGHGVDVSFPIGDPIYLSPEIVAKGNDDLILNTKTDVWSLGILLSILYYGTDIFGVDVTNISAVFELIVPESSPNGITNKIRVIIEEKMRNDPNIDEDFASFISDCLTVNITQRPTSLQLLSHKFIPNALELHQQIIQNQILDQYKLNFEELAEKDLDNASMDSLPKWKQKLKQLQNENERDPLNEMTLSQCFALWRMSGGNVEAELLKFGVVLETPEIEQLPIFVSVENDVTIFPNEAGNILAADLYSDVGYPISIDSLREKLLVVNNKKSVYLSPEVSSWRNFFSWDASYLENEARTIDTIVGPKLQLSVKDRDAVYQHNRIKLFEKLLKEVPFSLETIREEAKVDIPPLLRGRVWAALLEVPVDAKIIYDSIDKESETTSDRQLDADIPRCHQYNELLSSSIGHEKLRRVLKAWVVSENKRLVYWQGALKLSILYE
ncbi:hypothetical protein HK098_005865 [Nowakowskiella sp. JEL0407]|nr:hypothetical protein HK098_005865 [Nowakowskiella sp. JEL0407]